MRLALLFSMGSVLIQDAPLVEPTPAYFNAVVLDKDLQRGTLTLQSEPGRRDVFDVEAAALKGLKDLRRGREVIVGVRQTGPGQRGPVMKIQLSTPRRPLRASAPAPPLRPSVSAPAPSPRVVLSAPPADQASPAPSPNDRQPGDFVGPMYDPRVGAQYDPRLNPLRDPRRIPGAVGSCPSAEPSSFPVPDAP